MGRQDAGDTDAASLRAFTRHLLADLRALELMLRNGILETGVRRIGAEQEMFLLDRHLRPAPLAVPMMEKPRAYAASSSSSSTSAATACRASSASSPACSNGRAGRRASSTPKWR